MKSSNKYQSDKLGQKVLLAYSFIMLAACILSTQL